MPYNYFPVGYQAYMQQPQINNQMMSPPTIHAEIVQVNNEQDAAAYPVGVGASQMMIAKDDSAIFVKSATQNGSTLEVFVKRPPAPPEPQFDPRQYVTRDELEKRLEALLQAERGDHDEPI